MKTLRILFVALTVLTLAACGGDDPTPTPRRLPTTAATQAPPPAPTQLQPPTPTLAPTAAPTLEAFESSLTQALAWHQQEQLAALMGEPFAIALWRSAGSTLAAAEAAKQLLASHLSPNASPTFERPAPEQMAAMLGGTDPRTAWGADVKIADVIYSKGWGQSVPRVAFLAVAQRPDGRFYWHGILFVDAAVLTPKPAATAVHTQPQPALAITAFTCKVDAIATGKRLTFTWATTGATSAQIICQASVRFPTTKDVGPSGTVAIELPDTYSPNPTMSLIASDGQGHKVTKEIKADWPCRYGYFFPNGPGCPSGDPTTSQAGQESFQNGRMVWLKEIKAPSTTVANQILVLYNDGSWAQFEDTWQEGQPEVDTGIVAPAGLQQPKRGFGKLWRTNDDVRNKLGWATAEEQPYIATLQWQMRESLPSVAYLRTIDNKVIELSGQGVGSWKALTP